MARSECHVDAPPGAVYEILIDAPGYPRWLVGARYVRPPDRAWPRPGASFDHEVGAGPVKVHDATTVRDSEPGHRLDLVVRARPFLEADVRFTIEPDGTGSRIVMEETPRGRYRALAPLIGPLVKLRNDRSLRQLAELVGGRAA